MEPFADEPKKHQLAAGGSSPFDPIVPALASNVSYASSSLSTDAPAESYVEPQVVHEDRPRPRWPRHALLFLATCGTTYLVGGWQYMAALMTILLCHEFGHYLQAVRYRVPASLPYFIPVPLPPLGTMGAVIGMGGKMGNRRALFDIGITGPLAGLVPTLICCVIGLHWSTVGIMQPGGGYFGEPLLFQVLNQWIVGPIPEGYAVYAHPIAIAGWVGMFITGLNLIPIGQLDGGHILYALLRKRAHAVAMALLFAAIALVALTRNWNWSVMLILLVLMGPKHPPTANDDVPLGWGRIVLGWLTLLFIIVGFTPYPFG